MKTGADDGTTVRGRRTRPKERDDYLIMNAANGNRKMLYSERSLKQIIDNDTRKYDTMKNVKKDYHETGNQATYFVNNKTMYKRYIREEEIN